MTLDDSLDAILVQIGEFGKYQKLTFSLVCLVVIMHSAIHIAFVFTAMDLDYRCKIPGCDTPNPNFDPPWLSNAVPFTNDKPSKCLKYLPSNSTTINNCSAVDFDDYQTETCSSFIYKTKEKSIVQEFDIHCDNNLWKLTLVGTINNIGQFFGLFIAGLISDRFGRKVVLIFGMVFAAILGLIKTFSPTYIWFLIFEFLEAGTAAGTYACGFIIGVELVGPKKRVLIGTVVCCCYAVGEVLIASVAWGVQSWKLLTYIVYAPVLLFLVLLWLIPESIRWNLNRQRYDRAVETLKRAASVNGRDISETTLEKLRLHGNQDVEVKDPLFLILKTGPLLLRLINCCFCWITCAFLFYGLTLNSVALAGNSYLDFILTSLVEIPAYFACAYIVDKLGRRFSLCGSFFLTGLSCIVFVFIPTGEHYATLIFYLLGKFGATAAFTIAYVITSELFPTGLRQSLMGVCSTFGRIGSMISPQTPLLSQIWVPLPLIMYASMAIVAGLLTLLFPETVNTKLPDTIDEAVNIGKQQKK